MGACAVRRISARILFPHEIGLFLKSNDAYAVRFPAQITLEALSICSSPRSPPLRSFMFIRLFTPWGGPLLISE